METLNLNDVREYVNENIVDFHQRRIKSLEELTLVKLLKKNPYLFKAKNITTAGQLIEGLLDAFYPRRKKSYLAIFWRDWRFLSLAKRVVGINRRRRE